MTQWLAANTLVGFCSVTRQVLSSHGESSVERRFSVNMQIAILVINLRLNGCFVTTLQQFMACTTLT